jgi:hypothetical protein
MNVSGTLMRIDCLLQEHISRFSLGMLGYRDPRNDPNDLNDPPALEPISPTPIIPTQQYGFPVHTDTMYDDDISDSPPILIHPRQQNGLPAHTSSESEHNSSTPSEDESEKTSSTPSHDESENTGHSDSDVSNISPDSDTSLPSDGESEPSGKSQSHHPIQIALRKARKQRRRERNLLLMRQHGKPGGGHAAVPMRGRVADLKRKEFRFKETSHHSRSDHRKSREAKHKRVKIRNMDKAIENALERLRMSREDETNP